MIIDARQIESGAVLRADVCVIGAGAAGITLARRLRGRGRTVMVLESGGVDRDEPTQALCEGTLSGEPMHFYGTQPTLEQMRLRWLGGTTNHWGGWCRPLDEVDFAARSGIADTGWPFGREHLDPWYAEAQQVCDLGPYRYDAEFWTQQGAGPAALDTPQVMSTMFQLSPPTRFGERYRSDLEAAEDVTLCLFANVVDLPLAGDRVRTVDVAVLGGARFQVEAADVVLATGGIEVARMLLACNRDRPAGLGNDNDLVGRFFADHPHLAVPVVLADQDLGLYEISAREVQHDSGAPRKVLAMAALTPRPEVAAALSLQGLGAVLDFSSTVEAGPGIEPHDVGALLTAFEGSTADRTARLVLRVEQQPNRDSRVRLSTERDALGMQKVEVEWRLSPGDRQSLSRGLDLLADELARIGAGQVQTVPGGGTALERPLDIGCHHIGTARMHDDPLQGVVDANCRVHGLANLYIAGSAVFPTTGWSNPTLTIVALALRLADHLSGPTR